MDFRTHKYFKCIHLMHTFHIIYNLSRLCIFFFGLCNNNFFCTKFSENSHLRDHFQFQIFQFCSFLFRYCCCFGSIMTLIEWFWCSEITNYSQMNFIVSSSNRAKRRILISEDCLYGMKRK